MAGDCKRRTGGEAGISKWLASASFNADVFQQLEKGAILCLH